MAPIQLMEVLAQVKVVGLLGGRCMIKPDRSPLCSPNTVGVSWVSFFPCCLFFFLVLSIQRTAVLARRRSYLDR